MPLSEVMLALPHTTCIEQHPVLHVTTISHDDNNTRLGTTITGKYHLPDVKHGQHPFQHHKQIRHGLPTNISVGEMQAREDKGKNGIVITKPVSLMVFAGDDVTKCISQDKRNKEPPPLAWRRRPLPCSLSHQPRRIA